MSTHTHLCLCVYIYMYVCVCVGGWVGVYTYISGMIVKEHAFHIKQEQKRTYLKNESYVMTCQATCLFYILFCETLKFL